MTKPFTFPFGQPLTKVHQTDTAPNKKVFVLGVYASAVHAKWIGADNKEKVKALAVASEPNIFWHGYNAQEIINSINIPKELGRLEVPSDKSLNGPSSIALDNLFLAPLGFDRKEAWLCDLLPESRVNPSQRKAIDMHYTPALIEKYGLAPANIPDFDELEIQKNAEHRKLEILAELEASGANTIVLLGDMPIRWFLNGFAKQYSKLAQFGNTKDTYGQKHPIEINNKTYNVIPLCHPRNAAKLGTYSAIWADLHDNWVKTQIK